MIKVNSSQFNYQYGDQIHFPYSIASLVSYIKSKSELAKNFNFEKSFVFRDKIDDCIEHALDCKILLCSCYVWNWQITTHLAREVKKKNPECTIIFGGPQIPDLSPDFFKENPFVDIIVHGEGEYVFEEVLRAYLKDKDYSQIKGVETKNFRTAPQERIDNLDELPSPYLTNTVWELVDKVDGIKWISSWETNRGCPYQCTFCDWGSATFTKVRKWEESKIFKEIEWFGENKIPYIDCCDANFGIFQARDFRIAEKLKEVALKTHYPERIRPAWAKNSSEKILPIAKQLQEGGVLGAVTLAVQSLDTNTLDIMKRANIKFDSFGELTATFRDNNIPTYTELIMGLPGETLETFKQGLENIAHTKIDAVFIYHCSVLPNAPMNIPEYREKYGIKVVKSPIMLVHSSIHNRGIQEFEYLATENNTCSLDELKEIYLYSWSFLTLQSLGILEYVTIYFNKAHNLQFIKFYEKFLEYARSNDSILKDELDKVTKFRDDGYSGKGWDHHDPELGDIIWPIEEASWLRLTRDKKLLEDTIFNLLVYINNECKLNESDIILRDLAKFQVFILTTRDYKDEIKSSKFKCDWKEFFVENNSVLSKKECTYIYQNPINESDFVKWGYKTIWYGRRPRDHKCSPENLRMKELEIKKPAHNNDQNSIESTHSTIGI
jgi:radical SAM superfamily enzyme YgiQ (UPF0313 family)